MVDSTEWGVYGVAPFFEYDSEFYEFQFHGSVHHISVNENTNLMQQS